MELIEKNKCNGCLACYNMCPKKAIRLTSDRGGFIYPTIDSSICIDCGLCNKVCGPMNSMKQEERNVRPKVLGAYSLNPKTRILSTSGGIFSELADYIYSMDGYVCGAAYTKKYKVKHIISKEERDLPKLRSSKYIQSFSGTIYIKIKKLLQDNQKVLICATPCQIKALYYVLGRDYDNLYTCDFICRGVNAPKVFSKYVNELEMKYKSKVAAIKFKDKTYGWHNFSTKISFQNKKVYLKDRYTDLFMRGYLEENYFMRPACASCQFRTLPRVSDITLADFWGIENIRPKLDQNIGTSMVMVNSTKGDELIHGIEDKIFAEKVPLRYVALENPAMNISPKIHPCSQEVIKAIDQTTFQDTMSYYLKNYSKIEGLKFFGKRMKGKYKRYSKIYGYYMNNKKNKKKF